MEPIFTEALIDLDVKGDTKADVIASLASLVANAGRASDVDALIARASISVPTTVTRSSFS